LGWGSSGAQFVKVSDAGEAPIKSDTKANAVERAKEFAKNKVIAKVAIHKKEGTLQTKQTYGKDPICLQYLVKAINPRKVVAVGRTAQRALEKVEDFALLYETPVQRRLSKIYRGH
jgi:hypothetical protein